MSNSCPVPTPSERKYIEIQQLAVQTMWASVCKAITDAANQASEELRSSGLLETPPERDYFASVAHQRLFVLLCGGDPETFAGGDPQLAAYILDNGQKISDHYWGSREAGPEGFQADRASP